MEISKLKHELFMKMYTPLPNAPTVGRPLTHSLVYRLWILRQFNMRQFDSFDTMMIWFKRQLYTFMEGVQCMLKERSQMLRVHCYNLEMAMMDSQPASTADPAYQQHLQTLDRFVGDIIKSAHTSPNNRNADIVLASEYLIEPIPILFPLNTLMFEDMLFYILFEFNNDEIVFVGNDALVTSASIMPFARALRISEPMTRICHLNCFSTAYQAELREEHFVRLKTSLDTIEHMVLENTAAIQTDIPTANLLKETLKKIAGWLLKLLSDVHSHKTETPTRDIEIACAVYIQSREMWSKLASGNKAPAGTKSSTEANFTSFVVSSVSCHYSRLSKPFRPMTLDNFSTFVEALMPEITLNLNMYTRGFLKVHSAASATALTEFVKLYSADLAVVFENVGFLSPMVIQSVQSAAQFQIFLQELKVLPHEALPHPSRYVSNVVSSWCQNQEKSFRNWSDNIFHLDKFTAIDKTIKHSSSVVDLFQMFYQTINTLEKMRGSLSSSFGTFVITLSNMFKASLMDYNRRIIQITSCQLKQHLYPNSLNERIQKKGFRKSFSSVSTSGGGAHGSSSGASTKHDELGVAVDLASRQPIAVLCVCLNNLDFIEQNIIKYIEYHSYDIVEVKRALSDLFLSVHTAIKDTSSNLIDYIGAKIVFVDLRAHLLDHMYLAPLSKQSRIDQPLELLNPHLKAIYANTQTIERGNDLLTSVCRHFLQMMEYVLLYSGPTRHYNTGETQWIEEDLETVKEFFLDRDDQGHANGVEERVYDRCAGELTKVCNVLMDQPSSKVKFLTK
ncbi:hypothetical protein SAMD00019534_117700 [Acytostelium subglobosum LB1]|uniref:hypothetical protein n=1 Tax=Acytostelium subglobosum LB1 TaxID=1410327 RepID=UPI000644D847|nr:hypothetical protein SAMD00019534_117700 [Acytostelium subglobosum LB1]GAM28594.1 hypothetical protein SAMD00019534_117700 [Acytostelium subglobosum LB1]|eukprot:XP_012748372.1 hypothetical protein SAMD00019534_117700 [Acytostelium subglobosum LB1]